MTRARRKADAVRYTAILSVTALASAGVLVPSLNWFFHPEMTAYTLALGLVVTSLVAPPICYWSAWQYIHLHDTRKQLEDQNRELSEAKARAEAAAEVKTRFLAIMSHEIRTPLNGVLGMAQLLARRPLGSDEKILADTLLESGQSLMTLLNDLLDLSRSDSGQMEISPVPASLSGELRQIQLLFGPVAAEKGVAFHVEIAADVPERLVFDPVRLRQCVGNLVSNAIKFTAAGHVRVCARSPAPDRLTIIVEDTGCGLTPDQQARIFDAFTQASARTAQEHGGSGLGLTICRQLAGLMGGDVSVSSAPGQGSAFSLTVEVARPEPMHGAPGGTGSADSLPPEQWLENRRVLVVDDVATNRLVLAAMLERAGAHVRQAEDGYAALAQHREDPADLVLLDLQMPGIDGFETARRIRAGPDPDVPVIAISAHAQPEERSACIAAGMDGLMLKPIELRALYSEIARIGLVDGSRSALRREAGLRRDTDAA